tara:strand:- start:144 stop:761 length:618 start_codon:yes stop_codon:yes gene_type:complete
MPEFRVHNLWPMPIYESFLPVREKWKVLIKGIEYERTHVNNSDISIDRYLLNSMPELKTEIENHCENYVRKYLTIKDNAQFYLQNSWCNLHGPGEKSQIHYHGSSLLSGVYYPIFPKNSGDISFYKAVNHNNLFHSTIRFEYNESDNLTAETYTVRLREGTIVMFPAHIEHAVQPNESNENRYSIAFNFFVRGKFGKEEYQLELK